MNNYNLTIWPYGKRRRNGSGFSLIEMMAVLVIASMVIISALAVFNRAKKASASIGARLDRNDASMEVLQRIAEDLDRLVKPGYDIKVTVANKIVNGVNKSQLVIQSNFYNNSAKAVIFEKVIWQSEYDEFEDRLVVYRGHSGVNLDDKILSVAEASRDESEQKPFVPVCTGMTFFEFSIPQGEGEPLQQWKEKTLPPAVTTAMSFALPTELSTGEYVILDEDKEIRTIAIDRTKKIRFVFVKKEFKKDDPDSDDETKDPNDLDNPDDLDNTDKSDSIDEPGDIDEPVNTLPDTRK